MYGTEVSEEEENAYFDAMRIEAALYDELGKEAFYALIYGDDASPLGGFLQAHNVEQVDEGVWEVVS